MIDEQIALLAGYEGVRRHVPASQALFERTTSSVRLPMAHQAVLHWSNGLEAYFGYLRLFGFGSNEAIDALRWNDPQCWKFSWNGRCDPYWCFGETAWGDQYAYRMEDLVDGRDIVYFLDALSMTPEQISFTFDEFFQREFLRCARLPYDEMIVKAYRRFGPVELDLHFVCVPSPLLADSEGTANIQKMDGRAAMICNGDIATQLDRAPDAAEVKGVQPYEDEDGRLRLRLTWK